MKIFAGCPVYKGLYPSSVEALFSCFLFTQKKIPEIELTFKTTKGIWLSSAHTILVTQAIRVGADYFLFVEEDMVPQHDTLLKMLSYDVDCLTALYFLRNPPHSPCIFNYNTQKKGPEPVHDFPRNQLIEILYGGLGFCLVKMDVLKKIYPGCFQLIRNFADDYWFYKSLRAKGFKAFCHTGIQVGHIFEKEEVINYNSYQNFRRLARCGSTWVAGSW